MISIPTSLELPTKRGVLGIICKIKMRYKYIQICLIFYISFVYVTFLPDHIVKLALRVLKSPLRVLHCDSIMRRYPIYPWFWYIFYLLFVFGKWGLRIHKTKNNLMHKQINTCFSGNYIHANAHKSSHQKWMDHISVVPIWWNLFVT